MSWSQAHGLVANNFQEAAIIFLVFERATEQSFGESLNGGERSFELVRNIGDEILSNALQAAQLADIVENRYRAHGTDAARCHGPGFYGRGGDRKTAREHGAELEFAAGADAAGERGADGIEKLLVADHLEQRPVFASGRIGIQDFGEGPVAKNNALTGVDHCHALDHATQNRAGPVALFGEGADGGVHPGRCFVERLAQIGELVFGTL